MKEKRLMQMDVLKREPSGEMEYVGMILWIRIKWKSISVVVIHLAQAELKPVKALITWLNPRCALANRHACSILTSVSLANNPQQSACKLNYSRLIKWSLNCERGKVISLLCFLINRNRKHSRCRKSDQRKSWISLFERGLLDREKLFTFHAA